MAKQYQECEISCQPNSQQLHDYYYSKWKRVPPTYILYNIYYFHIFGF